MKPLFSLIVCLLFAQNIYCKPETQIKTDAITNDTCIFNPDCQACIDDPSTSDDDVPFFPVIFDEPDAVWTSPDVVRNGICCFAEGTPLPRCISFNVYLHENAVGMIFEIATGAIPGGALYYHIDCGPPQKVGEVICLAGGRFYTITFCEPGNNPNTYRITSVQGAVTTEDLVTCAGPVSVTGLEPGTIEWTVKSPDDQNLLRYLSCTDCANPQFKSDENTPSIIIYEVCGELSNTLCQGLPVFDCAEVTVLLNEQSSLISHNFDLSNKESFNPSDFKIYPNPNSGIFNIEFSSNKSKNALLEIYNSNGQLLLKSEMIETNNVFQERINLLDQINGIYYLRLIYNDQIFSKNLIIRKD